MNTKLKIKESRREKGHTQEYMAEQLGITQNAYSKIESGKVKLKADVLKRIGAILEKDINDLMVDDNGAGCQFEQHNASNSVGNIAKKINYTQNDFEKEREVWQNLVKSLKETIASKDDLIISLKEKMEAFEKLANKI